MFTLADALRVAVALARRRSGDDVVLVPVVLEVVDRVILDKGERVVAFGHDVDAGHVESGTRVSHGAPAGAAEQV